MNHPFKESVCSCDTCKNMCIHRPCWPTPEESSDLIDAGYGNRLMYDWWVLPGGEIPIISPAIVGYENQRAPLFPTGRCTFLTKENLCELHDIGLKPFEGRMSNCKNLKSDLHKVVSKFWDCETGSVVVKKWKSLEQNYG